MATGTERQAGRAKAKKARHAGGAPRRTPSCRLGLLIERLADSRGLHLDEVASKAGITFVALNDIRRGKTKNPSGITLGKLARVLGCPADILLASL